MFKRNEYIDYLKGIASIGIIAIHTAFWSGQSYTPEWFWNLTLLLDVPFFFYLSGWGGGEIEKGGGDDMVWCLGISGF